MLSTTTREVNVGKNRRICYFHPLRPLLSVEGEFSAFGPNHIEVGEQRGIF